MISGQAAQDKIDEFVEILKGGGDVQGGVGQYSFMGLLKKYLLQKKPRRILEWGSGLSTILMAIYMPNAQIITLEHNVRWFLYWTHHFQGLPNIKMYPLRIDGNYIEAPLAMGKFDLIFIDGLDETRAACLEVAAQVLNENGIVVIHDGEREYYLLPIQKFFRVVEDDVQKWNSHTVALELKK